MMEPNDVTSGCAFRWLDAIGFLLYPQGPAVLAALLSDTGASGWSPRSTILPGTRPAVGGVDSR